VIEVKKEENLAEFLLRRQQNIKGALGTITSHPYWIDLTPSGPSNLLNHLIQRRIMEIPINLLVPFDLFERLFSRILTTRPLQSIRSRTQLPLTQANKASNKQNSRCSYTYQRVGQINSFSSDLFSDYLPILHDISFSRVSSTTLTLEDEASSLPCKLDRCHPLDIDALQRWLAEAPVAVWSSEVSVFAPVYACSKIGVVVGDRVRTEWMAVLVIEVFYMVEVAVEVDLWWRCEVLWSRSGASYVDEEGGEECSEGDCDGFHSRQRNLICVRTVDERRRS
jgi:hypothetical protein